MLNLGSMEADEVGQERGFGVSSGMCLPVAGLMSGIEKPGIMAK